MLSYLCCATMRLQLFGLKIPQRRFIKRRTCWNQSIHCMAVTFKYLYLVSCHTANRRILKILLLLSAINQGFIGFLSIILVVFCCLSLYYYLSIMAIMVSNLRRYSIQNNQSERNKFWDDGYDYHCIYCLQLSLVLLVHVTLNINYIEKMKNIRIVNTTEQKANSQLQVVNTEHQK